MPTVDQLSWLKERFARLGFPGLVAAVDRIRDRGSVDTTSLGERMVLEILGTHRRAGRI